MIGHVRLMYEWLGLLRNMASKKERSMASGCESKKTKSGVLTTPGPKLIFSITGLNGILI